ncbi:MAG: Tetratricopeptide 2 repeat protein, partial [Bryobacterales bacterium]|nr:Tetratricopeptide 2 repeat protein [Bryobacterales bacterium]
QAGHFKQAQALLDRRLQTNPNDPEALYLLSKIKQAANDPEAASQLADKAVELDSKNARYHAQSANALATLADRAGGVRQISIGRRCKKEMELTLSLDPANTDALRLQLLMYLHAPAILGGDKAKARQAAGKIMQIDPVLGYLSLIDIAREEKRQNQIEDLFWNAVKARPSSYEAHIRLGRYSLSDQLKKYDQAESQGHEAIRIDPGRVDGYNILARSLVRQGKWTELDSTLTAAEQAVREDLTPYYAAANECLAGSLDPARAERYVRKYLTQEPELAMPTQAQAHALLGKISARGGVH